MSGVQIFPVPRLPPLPCQPLVCVVQGLCLPPGLSLWNGLTDQGNSLGFAPGEILDISSSSRPFGIPSTPRVVPPPLPQHHNCNNYEDWSRLLAYVEVMRGMLFDMRRDMDDLWFRLEIVIEGGSIWRPYSPLC
jgi:hypothetical protein